MNLFGCMFPCTFQYGWWHSTTNGTDANTHHSGVPPSRAFECRMGMNSSAMLNGGEDNCTVSNSSRGNIMMRCSSVGSNRADTVGRETGKKKRAGGLATLKRRFIKRRRTSKTLDHGRMLRDLVCDWTTVQLSALLNEFEALSALRDWCVQAELARPPATTFKQDLTKLYDNRICADVDLIYRGVCFPVHRAIMSVRCPYFRDLLNGCPGQHARICLELRTPVVDVPIFSALLRYLYTGDLNLPSMTSYHQSPYNHNTTNYHLRRHHNHFAELAEAHNIYGRSTIQRGSRYYNSGSMPRQYYTDNTSDSSYSASTEVKILAILKEEFGTPNVLDVDLRYLLEVGEYADAFLVFTSDHYYGNGKDSIDACPHQYACHSTNQFSSSPSFGMDMDVSRPDSGSSEYGFRPKYELPCHKAILSARSPFFRNLLQKKNHNEDEKATDRSGTEPTRIVIDESIIPKRFARVLLYAIYLDQVDLSLITRTPCSSELNDAASLPPCTEFERPSPLEEAMELYQIGRFVELDILSQGCEDVILELLNLDTLPAVLQWAEQPHGSPWVYRQTLHYVREEFQSIAQSNVLFQLNRDQLITTLQSPFVQASELEILQTIIKWGEHELLRRMGEREPNLLNHTTHSVTRKATKKREVNDTELIEIVSDLIPLVKIDHILPLNSECVMEYFRRGLLSNPPAHIINGVDIAEAGGTQTTQPNANNMTSAWIHSLDSECLSSTSLCKLPRFFVPYYDELRSIVEERLSAQTNGQGLSMARTRNQQQYVNDIPDTLYMISAQEPTATDFYQDGSSRNNYDKTSRACASQESSELDVDLVHSALSGITDSTVISAMLNREQKLRQTASWQRALNLPVSSQSEILKQIRLRIVREFNLPDVVAEMLESFNSTNSNSNNNNHEDIAPSGDSRSENVDVTAAQTDNSEIALIDSSSSMHDNASTSSDMVSTMAHRNTRRHLTFPRSSHSSTSVYADYERAQEFTREIEEGPFQYSGERGESRRTQGGLSLHSHYPHYRTPATAWMPRHTHSHQHGLYAHYNNPPTFSRFGRDEMSALVSNELALRPPMHARPYGVPAAPSLVFRNDRQDHPGGSYSNGHLSDIMPDVAMATSSLGHLHIQEQQEMKLDLGDGSADLHSDSAVGMTSSSRRSPRPSRAGFNYYYPQQHSHRFHRNQLVNGGSNVLQHGRASTSSSNLNLGPLEMGGGGGGAGGGHSSNASAYGSHALPESLEAQRQLTLPRLL